MRVRLTGICNTDIEILRGYRGFRGIPGHEFVGEVAEVRGISEAQKKKWVGKRVCGEINVSCSAHGYRPVCGFCKRGLKTHCARRNVLGIVGHDGAFTEYLTLPVEIDPRPLVTCTFLLSDAPAAIRFTQKPGVMKVLLKP